MLSETRVDGLPLELQLFASGKEIKGATISEVRTAMGGDLVPFMQAGTPDRAKLVRLRASPQAQITSCTYQPMTVLPL